jgi:23S rRNA pseudouridine2605 synthase
MKKKSAPAGRPESLGTPGDEEAGGLIRLNRYLALNGIASRRRADQLISEGEVMVDDEIVTELGRRVDPTVQRVEVDGVVLRPQGERKRYYLLNKPSGVVCTNDVRENRPRAVDLIMDRRKGRIYTVGRLDEDTVGLVLLTNDGDFAYRISHPRYGVRKVYRVSVYGRVSDEQLEKLRTGVRLSDFRASFEKVWLKKRSESRSTVLLTLREGRNREIRRVFAKLGLPVRDLRRVQIGNLNERGLKVGHWRPLVRKEVEGLLDLAREELAGPPPAMRQRRGRPRPQRQRGRRP